MTGEFRETVGSVGWRLGLGDLSGELRWITPESMAECRRSCEGAVETQIWSGCPEFGRDFEVKVVWRQVEPERCEGVLSWSGYEGRLQG